YIHASLCGENYFSGYIYDMTYENNFKEAIKNNIHFVFHGHTHIPYVYIYDQKKEIYIKQAPSTLTLDKENKFFLINSGSVGQPRDRDTRASFIILNEDTNEI
ncbi:MAG: metallophosphoesterase family protein, partial [Candidatus Sericytochromatia bacterium]